MKYLFLNIFIVINRFYPYVLPVNAIVSDYFIFTE
jgi:hypothetical protein